MVLGYFFILYTDHKGIEALFVATALVGNNLANYLTTLAIVLAAQVLAHGPGHLAELIAPIVLAPLVFVYGELLPKSLFLRAPNRLLRRGAPLFLFFTLLFLAHGGRELNPLVDKRRRRSRAVARSTSAPAARERSR